MEWSKIPTDLLVKKLTDNEMIAIVKYQSLWALLESQPDDKTALKYMTDKQLIIAKSWQDSIRKCVTSDIDSVKKKRRRDKKNYEKQKDTKDSDGADKIREDKIRNKEKTNKKEIADKFTIWWSECPKKVSKDNAKKIFEKLIADGKVTFDELLTGIKRYTWHCRQENTEAKFIKHPSTWLNQGCWNDVYNDRPPDEELAKWKWKPDNPETETDWEFYRKINDGEENVQ